MGVLRQISEYLYLKKRDPDAPDNRQIRFMHGVNRISLLMFFFAMIVLIIKLVLRHR